MCTILQTEICSAIGKGNCLLQLVVTEYPERVRETNLWSHLPVSKAGQYLFLRYFMFYDLTF